MKISREMEANERVQLASPILGILKGRRNEKKHNTKYSVFLHSFFFHFHFLSTQPHKKFVISIFFWDFICNFPHGMTSMYHRYMYCIGSHGEVYSRVWNFLLVILLLFECVGKNIKPLIEHEQVVEKVLKT